MQSAEVAAGEERILNFIIIDRWGPSELKEQGFQSK